VSGALPVSSAQNGTFIRAMRGRRVKNVRIRAKSTVDPRNARK